MSAFNNEQPRQANTGHESMPCFPPPRACDRLKPSFKPKPPPCHQKVCKIMPTDDSVFRIAPASDMALPIAVENLGTEPFKVEVNVAPDAPPICVKSTAEAPLVLAGSIAVQNVDDTSLKIDVDSDVCIKNVPGEVLEVNAIVALPTEPILVESCIKNAPGAGPLEVDANLVLPSLPLEIVAKFGWDEECDHAVPVFGQMEICNCCDTPFCVALSNKDAEPLCIQSVSSSAPITKPKCIVSCQYARGDYQDIDTILLPNYIGGYYPLACAAENQVVRIKTINYRFYSNTEQPDATTKFASESYIYLESDGEEAPFITAEKICELTDSGAVPQPPMPSPPTGSTCTLTNPPPEDATTYSYSIDTASEFGAPITLAPNDAAVLFYEVADPARSDSFPYYTPESDDDGRLQTYDMETKGCCEPAPSCLVGPPVESGTIYVSGVTSTTKSIEGESNLVEVVEFCTIDCFGQPVPSVPDEYTIILEYNDDSGFVPLEEPAVPSDSAPNKYSVPFTDIPLTSPVARLKIMNSGGTEVFSSKTLYTIPNEE